MSVTVHSVGGRVVGGMLALVRRRCSAAALRRGGQFLCGEEAGVGDAIQQRELFCTATGRKHFDLKGATGGPTWSTAEVYHTDTLDVEEVKRIDTACDENVSCMCVPYTFCALFLKHLFYRSSHPRSLKLLPSSRVSIQVKTLRVSTPMCVSC